MVAKLVRIAIITLVIFAMFVIVRSPVLADSVSVSANPSVQTVAPGATFDVAINVTTSTQSRGIQFAIAWDPTKVTCNSVSEGAFFQDFEQQNGLSEIIMPSSPSINNTTGTFPSTGYVSISLLGGYDNVTGISPGPTGTGSVYILHMTANSDASGTVAFTLSSVTLWDNNSPPVSLNAAVNSGQITISDAISPAPTIAGFSPTNGGPGTTVTITGTNFTNLTTVSFGSTVAQSFSANSDGTQIQALVGTGATGNVTVANTGGSVNSAGFSFFGVPTIASFSPVITGQGKTVTITGTNLTGATAVIFGDVAAQSFQAVSNTQITAVVGVGASGNVSVTTPGGMANKAGFTFAPQPTISSFNPTSGGQGTVMTITGTNFTLTNVSVTIGGVAAGYSSSTSTQVTATISAGATSGNVSVTTPGGTATLAGFTYVIPKPTIASFAPTSAVVGTTVVITGTNFTGVTAVSFGGTAARSFHADSTTQITAVVDTGASGTVSVTTPGGTVTANGFTFTTTSTTLISSTTMSTSTTTTSTTPSSTSTSTTTTLAISPSTTTTTFTRVIKTTPVQTSTVITSSTLGSITSLDISGSMDTSGMLHSDFLQGNIRYSGNNQIVDLDIKSGTRAVSIVDGSPVDSITIQPGSNVPSPPANQNIISAVEFGPTGTVFSSPITVVLGYDPTQVSSNTKASNLALECFNSQTGKWIECDYTVDTVNHQITAAISHFSLYAVMESNAAGFIGVGWSLAGIIIIGFLVLGGLVIYYFLRRTPSPAPETVRVAQTVTNRMAASWSEPDLTNVRETSYEPEKSTRINWDALLPGSGKKVEPFKTRLELTGGKIVIVGDGKSPDLEIINNPDSRVIISLEYDPELHPLGMTKIINLGSISESEK